MSNAKLHAASPIDGRLLIKQIAEVVFRKTRGLQSSLRSRLMDRRCAN